MNEDGMSSFLSIGECMVEFAPSGDGHFTMSFAGDTFNTAWYLRRMLSGQHDVGYATMIGTDSISDAMQAFMQEAGINIGAVHRESARTVGLYLIQLKDGERSFSYWRSQSAARQYASDRMRLQADLAGRDMIFFSGISLAILPEADRSVFLETLADTRQSGTKVVFDTNLRPRLWPTVPAMREWTERAAAIADIVMPSFEDEALYFGDKSPAATVERYGGNSETVVVKNASDPVLVSSGGNKFTVSIHPVDQVVDSTAAGDSFDAGFLAATLNGESLHDAVGQGAALAAKVVQGRGALVPV
jgi:2-dehydro-3-deoxygluconokinase